MDDDLRAYLDSQFAALRTEVTALRTELIQKLDTARGEFNDAQEKLLDRLTGLERDFLNARSFLLNDAITAGQRWFDHEGRLTSIERDRGRDGSREGKP